MSGGRPSLDQRLTAAPAAAFHGRLARIVPLAGLEQIDPHDWLFTSGRPNRYNPAGVECVYFAAGREIAQMEYDRLWQGRLGEFQPAATYYAEVSLARVLDLTDGAVLKALQIRPATLFARWRTAKRPTLTQRLGQRIAATGCFPAIRYPSDAAAAFGKSGTNLVLFRQSVRAPDSVRILGPNGQALQEWP